MTQPKKPRQPKAIHPDHYYVAPGPQTRDAPCRTCGQSFDGPRHLKPAAASPPEPTEGETA